VIRLIALTAIALTLAGPAAAQTAAWPTEFPPRPLAAREVKFPPYEIRTLPNGLRVVAVLHHEQPVVSIRLIVQAGTAQDPKGKLGLAALMTALLDQGTAKQSAQEINESIDFIGAAYGSGTQPDLSSVNLVVMKDSFDLGLRILADVSRRPAFAQEEIERQRQQVMSSLQVSFQDPEFVADAVFDRLVYGFHPYGTPGSGTPQTLAGITRDDLIAFHRRTFVPNNAILAIVGDVTAEEAFAVVTKAFGDWERREVVPQTITPPPDPTRRIVVVNKPDAVQTEIRVGHVGVRRNHPDYMPLNLAIRILGGEGANRLHQVLRTDRGLTYGAQADMATFRDAGDFKAETNTRTEATGEVLRLMLDQVYRLQRERVGERELGDAKAYLTGSFPLTIETPDAIATQVLNVLFFGLPIEQLQSFRERVNAVTVADIERVAREYLKPDRLAIVLVGNAAAFVGQIKALNLGPYEVIDMPNVDLTAVDLKVPAGSRFFYRERRDRAVGSDVMSIAATRHAGSASGDQGLTSRVLLERVITAKGGLDVLRGVKRIRAVARTDATGVEVTTYLEYPNRMRVESRDRNGNRVEAFDGAQGWVRDGADVHDVSADAIRDLQATFRRDTIALLLAAYDGTVTARRVPDVKDDRGAIRHALEFSSTSLDPIVVHVNSGTYLVEKQVYVAGGPGGAKRAGRTLVEEIFADYRTVGGVAIAFSATVRADGRAVYERRLSELTINPMFDDRLFTRPPS
jgi:zinc protease